MQEKNEQIHRDFLVNHNTLNGKQWCRCLNIGGHGMTTRGPGRGVGRGCKKRFSKNLLLKRFDAKFFPKVSRRFSKAQKGSVNLTFNSFLHIKFSFRYIMVPGGMNG